jgi:hypothetical protein
LGKVRHLDLLHFKVWNIGVSKEVPRGLRFKMSLWASKYGELAMFEDGIDMTEFWVISIDCRSL